MNRSLEKERIKAENLQRELDSERTQSHNAIGSERTKVSNLKSQLEVEKSRSQEMQNALQVGYY